MSQYETAKAALSDVLNVRPFSLFVVTPAVCILIISAHFLFFLNYLQTNPGSYMAGDGWRALVSYEAL